MDDDTRSKDLTLPEDEPWMSHGFISKIAAQVSLPYRRPKDGVKEIERRNGSLVVRYVSGADYLPYGKYPRLFELSPTPSRSTAGKSWSSSPMAPRASACGTRSGRRRLRRLRNVREWPPRGRTGQRGSRIRERRGEAAEGRPAAFRAGCAGLGSADALLG